MKRNLLCFLALVVVLGFTWPIRAQNQAIETVTDADGTIAPVVPIQIDPNAEPRALPQDESVIAGATGNYPWRMQPALYGFTPAPSEGTWFPAEFDDATGIVLGWPANAYNGNTLIYTELRDIARNAAGRMTVNIVVNDATRPKVQTTLQAAGVDLSLINFVTFPRQFPDTGAATSTTVDTIWLRDYGPEFVYDVDGNFSIIDSSYYPSTWLGPTQPRGRVRDDAVPTRLANLWGLPVYRPRLYSEGGNLQSDSYGTCFVSERMVNNNIRLFGSAYDLGNTLYQYYGCAQTVVLNSLLGEGTGHIDMFMTVISPTTIIMGQYDPADDPTNAPRLNANAQALTNLGYQVIRIPMPKKYYVRRGTQTERVWATFANSIRVNSATLVPTFGNSAAFDAIPALRDTLRAQREVALQIYRDALPDVEIIPVDGDPLIPLDGSLHCINITYY
jgi:agmatine deiminase